MESGRILLRDGERADTGLIWIKPDSQSLYLGHSLFETTLVRPVGRYGLFRADAHAGRLTQTARDLGWKHCPTQDTLVSWMRQGAQRFRAEHAGYGRLRMTAAWDRVDEPPTVWVSVTPYEPVTSEANVWVTDVRVPWTPVSGMMAPKSGSRIVYSMAERLASERGADEAILVDADGHPIEGAKSNLFVISSGRLVTAPVASGVLPGIARSAVIEIARRVRIDIDFRPPRREELNGDHTVFLTNALWGLRTVGVANGSPVRGDGGDLAHRLAQAYRTLVQGALDK